MRTQFARIASLFQQYIRPLLPQTKKHWIISGSFALGTFAILLFLGNSAHASDTSIFADAGTSILKMLAEALLWIARLCISMTVFALEFFIQLAKYNGYIDAPIVILGWTMIRDIANMFFVVVLLIIAFGTILGLEQYEWKKTMVNFIMAAIFINFSKMIAGLIIDVAHVFTMTFVSAIAATAGGNLINMFHLNSMVSIVTGGLGNEPNQSIIFEIFAGALMAFIFAVLAMATMGAYLVVMVARIVVLWALIILSPLAYILSVIPQTKSYADTWWSEFGKHVVVAPIMVFFLWLGFATLGTGSFVQTDLGINFGSTDTETAKALGLSEQSTAHPKVSISEVSTWENMANFILAIAFLWIGIEQVQKTGVRGGELLSDAKSFATKAAMIGSGYAVGKWLAGETYDKGKKGAVGAGAFVGGSLLGATRIPHALNVGAERIKTGWANTLGKGALQREASLKVWKDATEQARGKQGEIGGRNSSGGQSLANETILRAAEKTRGDSEQKKLESDTRLNMYSEEKKRFDIIVEAHAKKERDAGVIVDEKKLAEIQKGVLNGDLSGGFTETTPILQSLYAKSNDKQATGKAEKEIDRRMFSKVEDMNRVLADKIPKAHSAFLATEAKEDFDDFSPLSSRQRLSIFEGEVEKMVTLRAAYTTATGDRKKEIDKQLSGSTSKAMTLYSVAAENGESAGYDGYVGKVGGWTNESLQDADNRHKVMLSLFTGATKGEVDADATAVEAQLRQRLGDKADGKMAMLGTSLDREAEKKGSYHNYLQVTEGYDENGIMIHGFANNMLSGKRGTTVPTPTGTATKFSSGEIAESGEQIRSGWLDSARATQKLKDVKDGRTVVAVDKDRNAVGFVDKATKAQLLSIGNMTALEIKNLNKSILNLFSGGKFEKSSFDGTDTIKAGVMSPDFTSVVTQLKKSSEDMRLSPAEKDRNKKALIAFLEQITGNQVKDYDDALTYKIEDSAGSTVQISSL